MVTKQDIIKVTAGRTNKTQKEITYILSTFQDCFYEALETEEPVKLFDGIIFEVKNVKPRTARNPMTGETIEVPAKKKLSARFGKKVKEFLNEIPNN